MAKTPASTLLAAQRRGSPATWHGTAFVVEALVLLVFLAFALATFMQLFGAAHERGVEERQLTQAVLLATNDAERFAAAPLDGSGRAAYGANGSALDSGEAAEAGTFVVTREVTPVDREGGTLYRATITVKCDGETVYELETARYVSDGAQQTAGAVAGGGAGTDANARGGDAA